MTTMTTDQQLKQPKLLKEYLRELDRALQALPRSKARELREQITTHLDEAITPEMREDEVRAVLAELGQPVDLVADAAREPRVPNDIFVGRLRARRTRKRRWTIAGAVVGVLAVLAAVFVPLCITWSGVNADPVSIWGQRAVYGVSASDVTYSQANGETQTTIQLHPHTQQAMAYTFTNDTNYTQTILGFDPKDNFLGGGAFQLRFFTGPEIDVLAADTFDGAPPATVAPHHSRTMLLAWTTAKFPCFMAGGGAVLSGLRLRVHVGWVTRTENIRLPGALGLYGPSGTCPGR
jgi:hypothetical protein